MLKEAIAIIKSTLFAGFGVAVDVKYLKSMSLEARKRIGDPQLLCFQKVIRMVIESLAREGVEEPIAAIFDDSEDYGVRCYRIISQLRRENPAVKKYIGSVSFADDEMYLPLQAADILAYETAKELKQKSLGYRSRDNFTNLVTPDDPSWALAYESAFLDGEYLEELDQRILRRESAAKPD